MRVRQVIAVPATGGSYHEDLRALQARPVPEDERWRASAQTPGFRFVREPVEVVSVGLQLALDDSEGEGSAWVFGDCVAATPAGRPWASGPTFRADQACRHIEGPLARSLVGLDVGYFRGACAALVEPLATMHRAIAFGVTQALLAAAATVRGCTMAEVIAEEWDLPLPERPVPLHASCGGERRRGVDKMVIRGVPSLPAGQVDDLPEQVGWGGEVLLDYARWLRERVALLGPEGYAPTIHLNVSGALGVIFGDDPDRVADYLAELSAAVAPLPLRIEGALRAATLAAQLDASAGLRAALDGRGLAVELVAGDFIGSLPELRAWAERRAAHMVHVPLLELGSLVDSIEAVLALREAGVQVLLGGSGGETEVSARAAVHVALATQPDLLLARPGTGVDEALMLCGNETARTLRIIAAQAESQRSPRRASGPLDPEPVPVPVDDC